MSIEGEWEDLNEFVHKFIPDSEFSALALVVPFLFYYICECKIQKIRNLIVFSSSLFASFLCELLLYFVRKLDYDQNEI